ncbi:hypothetical protein C8J57DRAFT_1540563 [Mycena rebaudengoi]|nr:hypothetical protein C8J57DRAFT_1540563 [Mycena rebaudengoi]
MPTSLHHPMHQEIRDELRDIENIISENLAFVKCLEDRRDSIRSQLDTIIYPILTLPPEITSEISIQCLPSIVSPNVGCAPLIFLAICTAWRNIAISTPALWDHFQDADFTSAASMERTITQWFRRAGRHPLTMEITYTGEPDTTHTRSLVNTIAPQILNLDLCHAAGGILSLAGTGPFPILQKLTIAAIGDPITRDSAVALFNNAPQLHNLTIANIPPSILSLPWSQITKFTAYSLSIQECLGVLRLATTLREFHRSYSPLQQPSISPTDSLECSHATLLNLTIDNQDGDEINGGVIDIMPYLILPSLKELEIRDDHDISTLPALNDIVVPFLQKTSVTLTKLTVAIESRVPTRWLNIFPRLTTLELCSPGLPMSNVLRALDRSKYPQVLPALETLVYSESIPHHIDQLLIHVLQSRCKPDATDSKRARLQHFHLTWSRFFEGTMYSEDALPYRADLQELVRQGLQIQMGVSYLSGAT